MAVKHNGNNYPNILYSFLKWLLSGDRELKEENKSAIKNYIFYHYVQYEV